MSLYFHGSPEYGNWGIVQVICKRNSAPCLITDDSFIAWTLKRDQLRAYNFVAIYSNVNWKSATNWRL